MFHSPAGIIPQTWRRYTVPQGITVIQWITDFSKRVKQLQKIVQATTQGGAKELKVHTCIYVLLYYRSLYFLHTLYKSVHLESNLA